MAAADSMASERQLAQAWRRPSWRGMAEAVQRRMEARQHGRDGERRRGSTAGEQQLTRARRWGSWRAAHGGWRVAASATASRTNAGWRAAGGGGAVEQRRPVWAARAIKLRAGKPARRLCSLLAGEFVAAEEGTQHG